MNQRIIINFILIFIISTILIDITYARWYEEPEVYETKNIDNMWWLSKKKKEELKKVQNKELEKRIQENNNKNIEDKKIKWLYDDLDTERYPKNKWELIDEDNDGIAYNYYFDEEGYLVINTVIKDYRIVDKVGREIDYNFRPIEYNIISSNNGIAYEETTEYIKQTRERAKVIIGQGVKLTNKEKIYDSSMNKNMLDYIDKSNRFINSTNAIIYNEIRWQKCCSLKGNDGYVIFNNPNNNFNKVTGYISTEHFTEIDSSAKCTLKVYDADLYDKLSKERNLYDIEEIYTNDRFNNTDRIKFSFTFDRSIRRLRFEIETRESSKSLTCYMKDLRYGFSKAAFSNELKRKKEDEEEIEELKRLGIYVKDYFSFDSLDEDGDIIEEEIERENENNDDRIGGISYISEEETINYEDVVRDRSTGPAFDEKLKNIKEVGPSQN